MARSIAGLFPDRASAERALVDLKSAGFDPQRMGVVMRDKQEMREVAQEHGTHSTEGAVAGGLIGGSVGAILAATGALVIPGVGPFISAGILATSLVGGAAGWLVGGLAGLGIPREEAEYYEQGVQAGGALVTVDAQGRDAEAQDILLRNGAEDTRDRGWGSDTTMTTGAWTDDTTRGAGMINNNTTMATPMAGAAMTSSDTTVRDGDTRIPVREEELVAGKRMTEQGRVHLHKDVVEEQQIVNVPLRRDEITVERVPVNREVRAGDLDNQDDSFVERDIDVPVMGEEAVIDKRTRVVEEVRLHKDQMTENEQVSDMVRKERVIVDDNTVGTRIPAGQTTANQVGRSARDSGADIQDVDNGGTKGTDKLLGRS